MPSLLPWEGYYNFARSLWTFPISCGGHTHRLVIINGRIRLPDHPNIKNLLFGVIFGRKSLPSCVKCFLAIRHHTYRGKHGHVTFPYPLPH